MTPRIMQTDTVAPSSVVSVAALARPAGFTLIELIVSVAVLAIVIILAVPSLTNLMLDAGLKTTAIDVHNTMAYARSEAIKRNAIVDIIPTDGN